MATNEQPIPVATDGKVNQQITITGTDSEVTDIEHNDPRSYKSSPWRKFVGIFWDSVDGSPKRRRYIQKLDTYLLSYICLGYFIKQIDQTNMSNAYVSGMKEDLELYGNERNWLNTYFNVGIILGTLPAQMIQLRWVRPSIWIPCCELFWSIFVIGMGFAKNVETLYVLRFFVGFAEACCFPGFAALLGGWYGPMELGKRAGLFEQSSAIGEMVSGYLQAALYTGLNGTAGKAGWQWMFVFDGIIGIPIAIWGLFAIPDLPHTTRAFYFGKEEKEYGIERVESFGRAPPEKLTFRSIGRVFTNWRLWAFVLPYLMVGQANGGTRYFNLWLKDKGYSVVDTNTLPTAGNALSIVAAIGFGVAADYTGHNAILIVAVELLVIAANIILSVWYVPNPVILFANYLLYVGFAAQPIVIAWGHHLAAADPNLRQLLVATGNVISYCFNAWLPLGLFPTYDAPKYDYGYQILILFSVLAIGGTVAKKANTVPNPMRALLAFAFALGTYAGTNAQAPAPAPAPETYAIMPLQTNTTPFPPTSIAFVAKHPDMSFEDFKTHYETQHIPLFLSLVDGSRYIESYILQYAPRNETTTKPQLFTPPQGSEDWEYDAIASIVYKSQEAYEELGKKYAEHYETISDDEAKFIDQAKLRAVVVREGESTQFVLK
ncbi:MFS transporter PfmaC [Fulvia fulva]|nr:MFS transporter PfmaC [Fulvia fulva]KAK4609488.1 MFS transporter PfmaC [Fulvia fulva]WPV37600.1 MFS transporter PfmaC [Fulvia fulva]